MEFHIYPKNIFGKLTPAFLLLGFLIVPLQVGAQPVYEQSMLLSAKHTGNSIAVAHAVRKNLPFHEPPPDKNATCSYSLLSQDNKELYTGWFHDPLEVYVDNFSDPAHPRGSKVRQQSATFVLNIPYLVEAKRIRFECQTDNTRQTLMGESPLKEEMLLP